MRKIVYMLVDIQFNTVLLKKGETIEVEAHESIPDTFYVYFNGKRNETDLLWNKNQIFEDVVDKVA